MNADHMVSIVMTSYNRCHYIGQAIDSVLSQKCNFSFEIIIGDDCSTDSSREILNKYKLQYPETIVLNYQKQNLGCGRNWASTLKLARAKYVAFLDDDDYWCDNCRLQKIVDYLESNNHCGLVYTNRWIYNAESGVKNKADIFIPDGVDKVHYLNVEGFPILFSSTVIRKSMIDEYVNLDDYLRFDFPIQDWPTVMLIAPHCDFHYIETPSVVYRICQGSLSRPKEYEQIIHKYEKEKQMCAYVYNELGLCFDELGYDSYVTRLLLNLAYRRGDYREARKYSKLLGGSNRKVICSKCRITFMLYIFVRNIIHKFS